MANCWSGTAPAPRPLPRLQPRINRQAPGRRMLAEAPVILMAYDLLEEAGTDLRPLPLHARRDRLARAAGRPAAALPPAAVGGAACSAIWPGWPPCGPARDRGAEGLMLKHRDSPYHAGRKTGGWLEMEAGPVQRGLRDGLCTGGSWRRATCSLTYTLPSGMRAGWCR